MAPFSFEEHDALTSDLRDISSLHFPNSCFRPPVKGIVSSSYHEPFVDWPQMRKQAWDFAARPYAGEASLDRICPDWWNATGCECECGSCTALFEQCPVGFVLFRGLSLLCAARGRDGVGTRYVELVRNRWGRGLLDMMRLRLSFKDILHSGWPYFGVLSHLAGQLQMDGFWEGNAVQAMNDRAPLAPTNSLCHVLGWHEDLSFQEQVLAGLRGAPMPTLVDSRRAASAGACPLQRAVARVVVADWLLQETPPAAPPGTLPRSRLREVEAVVQQAEEDLRAWGAAAGKGGRQRPYFFELLVTAWPVWQALHRVGLQLLAFFALACEGTAAVPEALLAATPTRAARAGSNGAVPGALCPACPCPLQGEWVAEARYISRYARRLSSALLRRSSGCGARRAGVRRAVGPAPGLVAASWRPGDIATDPLRPWRGVAARRRGRASPARGARELGMAGGRREAFATVLFARGSSKEQALLHAEAIRTLAYSTRQHSLVQRPFLVVTDGPLPSDVGEPLRADGITVVEVRPQDVAFPLFGAYGAGAGAAVEEDAATNQLKNWWIERGIPPTAVKLTIWNMTDYDCLVFLDADMLLLDSVDELFALDTFAVGLNPYSSHMIVQGSPGGRPVYSRFPGINTGVMVVQPAAEVAAHMAQQMAAGVHDHAPVAEHLGQSDQPWLDAFWLHYSRRLGLARFGRGGRSTSEFLGCEPRFRVQSWEQPAGPAPRGAAGCSAARRRRGSAAGDRQQLLRPGRAQDGHCVLPVEYDFFADYKAVRTHVWSETKDRRAPDVLAARRALGRRDVLENASDIEWSVRQLLDVHRVLTGGIKILHWPGELRKPWHRWYSSARSTWDEAWWAAHDAMCSNSSAECRLRCVAP